VKKENETVVFKPDNSIAKIIDKRNATNDDRSVGDDTDFVVSDTKFIRANMEVIEAEMNTVMQELAKLDTQLGLREIEEETEGDFGIVEEEEEEDDDDNGMDGSMDEDTQNFKRMR
jgi:hypothetical protein